MPAATRPIWKGQLRLSLVSIAVELFTATKSTAKTTFNQIHAPTGKRIHYQKIAEGVGPVEAAEIKKGYEYEKGQYVLIEDEELDAVRLETRKTLELVQFVDDADIPPLYYDTPHFLAPADDLAEDAFRVIRDALKTAGKVGIGQLALRGKEHLVAVKPFGRGLLLETLHYEDELKKPEAFFSEVSAEEADPELLEVATALIGKKARKFDPKAFTDHYNEALSELIQRKLKSKGALITAEDDEPRRSTASNVVDLMAALKKSLEGDTSPKPAAASKSKAAKPAAAKAPAKAAAGKPAAKAPPRKKAS